MEPAVVADLDEAVYRDFPADRGGTVVVRKERAVSGVTGLLARAALISIARRAAARLP